MKLSKKEMRIYYNPKLTALARALRRNSTKSEKILWSYLKGDKVSGCDFHRQKPIGNYIVDFYCHQLRLVIEVDGMSHDGKYENDLQRQRYLEGLGLTVLRFDDQEVKNDIDHVLKGIQYWIEKK